MRYVLQLRQELASRCYSERCDGVVHGKTIKQTTGTSYFPSWLLRGLNGQAGSACKQSKNDYST